MEDGDHRPGDPAEPAVVDEVVHGRGRCPVAGEEIGLLRPGEDSIAVPNRLPRLERDRPRNEPGGDIDELLLRRPGNGANRDRTDLGEIGDLAVGGGDQCRSEVEGIDAGKRQRLAVTDRRGRMLELVVGDLQTADDRRLLAGETHRHVADGKRAPVAGDAGGVPPAFRRQPRRAVESVFQRRRLVGRELDDKVERCRATISAGHEPVFLGDGEPAGKPGAEPHPLPCGEGLGRPIAVDEAQARKLIERLTTRPAIDRFQRQPEGERIGRIGVGILHRRREVFGTDDLERATIEIDFARRRGIPTPVVDGNLSPRLRAIEGPIEPRGIGHRHATDPFDDVADGEPGQMGRGPCSDDTDAASSRHRRHGQVPHRPAPVVLIVIALAGQLNPLHRRAAAGKRIEHLGCGCRIERPESMAGARGRVLGRLGGRVAGPDNIGITVAASLGEVRGLASRERCVLGAGRFLRRGDRQFGISRLVQRAGEEPCLEELTAENDRESDESELNVTAFHDLLGRFTAHRAPWQEPLRPQHRNRAASTAAAD